MKIISSNIVRNKKLRDNEDEKIFQLTPPFFLLNLNTLEQRHNRLKVSLKENVLKAHLYRITILFGDSSYINLLMILKLLDNLDEYNGLYLLMRKADYKTFDF